MADQSIPTGAGFPHRVMTRGPAGTRALGVAASRLLQGGEIILLHGDLGAGKTCFVQGLGQGLRVKQEVVSPTFTLVNTYDGRLQLHHLDFYRVEPGADLEDIGVSAMLDEVWDREAVLVVEWPEPLLPFLGPAARLELLAVPGSSLDERLWWLRGSPSVPPAWADLFDETTFDPATGA
jgi:tRNA threonylcarbamoyladenosine biosynthesis protein TsaE